MNFTHSIVRSALLVTLFSLGFASLGYAQSASTRPASIVGQERETSMFKKESTRPARPDFELTVKRVSTGSTFLEYLDALNWTEDELQDLERLTSQDPVRAERRNYTSDLMRPITQVSIDIRDSNKKVPPDRSVELANYVTRDWTSFVTPELAFMWQSPDIRYQQLYFENISLERYGQTVAPYRQVYRSGAHFFFSVVLLPYHMWANPSKSCDTPLGYCRPGNDVPWVYQLQFFPR